MACAIADWPNPTAVLPLPEAVAAFRHAIDRKHDYWGAYYNLGLVLAKQNKPAEAVLVYQKAVDFKPDFANAYNNLGANLSRLQRLP